MYALQDHCPPQFGGWAPDQRSIVGYTKLQSRPLHFALGAKDWLQRVVGLIINASTSSIQLQAQL